MTPTRPTTGASRNEAAETLRDYFRGAGISGAPLDLIDDIERHAYQQGRAEAVDVDTVERVFKVIGLWGDYPEWTGTRREYAEKFVAAMMNPSEGPAYENLYRWWHERWAPTLQKVRARLGDRSTTLEGDGR